ncbi:MAG: YlbF family regulator [Chthoniobacter sp.]|uniref:YlbF family regulator n=1 Tax=Chthoniobacter sp. TaxID=2510640 RepID=UPI0032A1B1DC
MDTKVKESPLTEKTLDLCQAIADQADFQTVKQKLDAFMSNELLKYDYQQLTGLGDLLRMKQSQGGELKPEEVAQFETMREKFMADPVAVGFLDAQDQLQQLHENVSRFLNKTFELGRRPEFEDVHDGSCSDCGCH